MKRHKEMELRKALLNLQEYCSEHDCCFDCALHNMCCTLNPCNWNSKDIGIMVKVMGNEVSD